MPHFTYTRVASARRSWLRPYSAVLALTLAAASGCSELSGPSDKTPPVTGSYTLADVGGNRLPATIYEGPYTINGQRVTLKLAVQSATLQLTGNSYKFQVGMTATIGGQTAPLPILDEGTYTRNGSQLSFRSNDATVGSFAGTVSQDRLEVAIDFVGDQHPPIYQFRR
jgi:hypothetical protein